MGIEQLVQNYLAPLRWLDERVQQEYTRLGQQLSDNLLYPVTFGLCTIGLYIGAAPLVATLGSTVSNPYIIGAPFGLFAFDFYYNILGIAYTLAGHYEAIKPQQSKEDSALSPILPTISVCQLMNKIVRLPTLFLSLALTGKAFYDIGASFSGRVSSQDPFVYLSAGIGFLSVASSMYLKDRNQ